MPEKSKKIKNSSSNGFTFEFGGGTQKVKALVARKRPPIKQNEAGKQVKSTAAENTLKVAPKSIAIRRKVVNKPNTATTKSVLTKTAPAAIPTKNFVKAPSVHSDGDSDLESYIKLAKPQPVATDLMLNICTTTSSSFSKPKPKPKLSKQERIQQKRDERKGNGPLPKRTLSSKEIHAGLRKFSQNPNQKPRASDIFEQKEREAKESLIKENQTEDEIKEALELGEVDPNARKSNAFRVKRPGDSSVRKIGLFKDQPEKVELGQRLVRPITEKIFDGGKVESLGLHAHSVKNLLDLLGINQLTTVQQKCVPKALEGKVHLKSKTFKHPELVVFG